MQKVSIFACGIAALALGAGSASAQFVLVNDSSNNRVMLFSAADGSLINDTFIDLGAQIADVATPKGVAQVGNEIWVTDQVRSRVHRFNAGGTLVGTLDGVDNQFSNLRGIRQIGDTVYVSNGGTANDAPGRSTYTLDLDGNVTGNFAMQDDGSPWDTIEYNGELLISHSTTDRIDRYDFDGNFLGVFAQGSADVPIRFIQQMAVTAGGNLLAAGFSPSGGNVAGVFEFDSDGNFLGIPAGEGLGPRGVYELADGRIMWTNGGGVWIDDELVFSDASGQFIAFTTIPSPAGFGVLALAGFAAARRRR